MKRMSTATHGLIDYFTAGLMALTPRFLKMGPAATVIVQSAAGSAAAYSAMTNYERGLVRVLPMKAHLTLDALSGGMLLGAALMMDDETPEARMALAGIGLFEITAALTTQTRTSFDRPRRAGQRRRDSRGRFRRQSQLQHA